jgi:hypothetical protein
MRVNRTPRLVVATLALVLGASAATVAASPDEQHLAVDGVLGAVELDPPTSFGAFAVVDEMYQHRGIPVTGDQIFANDARLMGSLAATMNFDIDRSGQQPVPAWGSMSIDDGAWSGTFTGIRREDFEPFEVRAFLVGSGEYDGLCAVLDITAGNASWAIDGVIHPLPMGA